MNATKLMQQGYMCVATFNQKSRADARAEFHRKQGHEAKVVSTTGRSGIKYFFVYIRLKEV